MLFPHDAIPDGNIMIPHHFTYFALLAFILTMVVWDDYRDKEPIGTVSGIILSFYAWFLLWNGYNAALGAILTLTGLTIALGCAIGRKVWKEDYSQPIRYSVILLLLAASDDVLEHAFGIWTPLDWIWNHYDLKQKLFTAVNEAVGVII